MKQRQRNAFTLIELIAVLVIMAIIALIATPLVMSIIRKARISADKRSVDAYGRSIELAIAGYLLDTGKFPTSVEQLTIEYSGNQVVCSTTQINTDSSVYLSGCTVAGRSTGDYTYGEEEVITYDAYQVGDAVIYNNVNYYVIKDSSTSEESVTLLKAEPLSYSEVQTYSNGTGSTTSDQNGYGGMQYHSSSIAYEGSYIKTTVDAWKTAQAPAATEARLITYDELIDNLGYDSTISSSGNPQRNDNVPTWVYNLNYKYWTSSQYPSSSSCVWSVTSGGSLDGNGGYSCVDHVDRVVRPVITISKSNISNAEN